MGHTKKLKAGESQEKEVAFYLRREFSKEEKVTVHNDVRLTTSGDENAQIDHLLVYPEGFLIIESKSVYGEVTVNHQGEWSRSYKSQWYGMKSPIIQAEDQIAILKEVLQEKRGDLLDKMIFGAKQAGFKGRCYDVLVGVSSSAILHRDSMPDKVSECIFKSEFVAKEARKIIDRNRGFLKSNPTFSSDDIARINDFLTAEEDSDSKVGRSANVSEVEAGPSAPKKDNKTRPKVENPKTDQSWAISCKKCSDTHSLTAMYGKYGYYVKCGECGTNTSMNMACIKCGGKKTTVKKSKNEFRQICSDCNSTATFVNSAHNES